MKKIILLSISILTSSFSLAVCPDGKTYPVHFTFDDGPHPTLTPRVLDILKEEKVKATFFVLGDHFPGGKSNRANKPLFDILDREKREGHKIGSHTYSHLNHPTLSPERIRENITKSNPILKDYLSPILRLPYGGGSFRSSNPATQKKNDLVMKTVKDSGMKHVGWDIDTNDWDARKRANLLPTLLRDICREKGGIVLFHDVQKNTVDNLRAWIRAVKAEGHTFVGMDKFVPEVNNPLPEKACEYPPAPAVPSEFEELMEKFK